MKVLTGKVLAVRDGRTAKVAVRRIIGHKLYSKRLRRTRNYFVDNSMEAKEGETVRFADSKPVSKTKKWKIVEIVGRKEKPTVAKKKTKNKRKAKK